MKACIFGAGAIGGWLGLALARSGAQLSAVARGATLAALQAHGLRLLRPDGSLKAAPVQAAADPAALGVQDLVVIAVKAPALPAVAQAIAPLIGPQTQILTAMNGVPSWFTQGVAGAARGARLASVDPDGLLHARLPLDQVVGGVVHASCSTPEPGLVRQHFGNQILLGRPAAQADDAALQAMAQRLVAGGVEAQVSPRIQQDIWYKLWGNLTMNPISALTGATTDRILDDPLVRSYVTAVMLEAKALGAALGLPIDQQPADRHAVTRKLGAFKTSMLQDVEAGRPLEIDALLGAVHELGQLAGQATPHTDALLGLTRLMARTRGLY